YIPVFLQQEYLKSISKDEIPKILDDVALMRDNFIESSNVLVYLFSTLYYNNNPHSIVQMRSFLFELLESPNPQIRAHSFHLLYNIGVYIGVFEREGFIRDKRTYENFEFIREDLFDKYCDMILFLLYQEEKDDEVW